VLSSSSIRRRYLLVTRNVPRRQSGGCFSTTGRQRRFRDPTRSRNRLRSRTRAHDGRLHSPLAFLYDVPRGKPGRPRVYPSSLTRSAGFSPETHTGKLPPRQREASSRRKLPFLPFIAAVTFENHPRFRALTANDRPLAFFSGRASFARISRRSSRTTTTGGSRSLRFA